MKEIQLLYVINEVSNKKRQTRQEVSFLMLVENLSCTKNIDVVWAGEDGQWHTLPARFHAATGENKEYWKAHASFILSPKHDPLPGNITFALRYQTGGDEFWDNNHNLNYLSLANSGIQVTGEHPIQNIDFNDVLESDRKLIPITVVTSHLPRARKVKIHWTVDNWAHVHIARCYQKKSRALNRDGHPVQDGVQVWKGLLNIGNAFELQYSICCESENDVVWDNNFGRNYSVRRKPLKVMILNLHCYQEENQDEKLTLIAKAIDDQGVDIVCLQEVAEPWNGGMGMFETNTAKIINDRLPAPFHLHTDWSHLGFDKYREGVAILSRYPFIMRDSRYVSESRDPYNIHARKVVMAQIAVPSMGPINIFSSHLSWWEDGFQEQFENLVTWAESKRTINTKGTMLCGDFNIKAGSKGYELVVDSQAYEDQFLAANSPAVYKRIFKEKRPLWQRDLNDDHRIDYIFMHKSSSLRVTSGRELFTEQDYGRVSDHSGYLMTFEPI